MNMELLRMERRIALDDDRLGFRPAWTSKFGMSAGFYKVG
jgi:hypothetical protein